MMVPEAVARESRPGQGEAPGQLSAGAAVPEKAQSTFLPLIISICGSDEARAAGWSVRDSTAPHDGWILVRSDRALTPQQGWKIHITANPLSADEVLRRVLPVLLEEHLCFKVAASAAMLSSLNHGDGRLSQIGKFITVYPNDDHQAVRLAVVLDRVTSGLEGPAIPSDRPLRSGSLVHYRYGGFGDCYMQTPLGEILPALSAPDGTLIPDRRLARYSAPEWAADPFTAAGIGEDVPEPSRLVGERYLIVTTLHRSPRGMVYLAIDLHGGRRCILKRAMRGATMSRDGRDARDRLRHEAEVLLQLAPNPSFPEVYELLQEGADLYLALEDIDGVTLEAYVGERIASGCCLATERVVSWGCRLAAMLGAIHEAGFVYRDLKSPNVIVQSDDRLRLIDFELAWDRTSGAFVHAYGTRGYVSPQQAAGGAPSIADDIYGLGALLYFMAGGVEPSLAPREFALLDRPITLLNPAINPALERVVARCLDPDSERRFGTMAAVEAALRDVLDAPSPVPPVASEPVVEPEAELSRRCLVLTRRLGDTLCAVSQPPPAGTGRVWISSHYLGAGIRSRDLNVGSAGPVLALADLVLAFDDPEHRRVLEEGARWLAASTHLGERPLPGLYIGEAGIGAALLRAGQVLRDASLVAAAAARGRVVAAQPHISPDLFNGTAGRLRFHLLLWDETGAQEHLRAAVEAGAALLEMAERDRDGREPACWWRIPDGYDGLSGKACLGYAHGAAGIADALLDLFEATGERRFLSPATATARWLARLAVPALDDGSGLDWPEVEGGAPARLWCHGAAGVGRFFLHAAQLGVAQEAAEIARRAAWTVVRGARGINPVQCHGLAGTIEFALDARALLEGDSSYNSWLWSLARLLEAFAVERDGLLVFPSESPATFSPDYMVGYAGVAMCLLRLGNPARQPHQLGRPGFRHGRAAMPANAGDMASDREGG